MSKQTAVEWLEHTLKYVFTLDKMQQEKIDSMFLQAKRMETELNKNEKLSTEQETLPIANVLLYAVYSTEFDKWEKEYNPSNCFIDGGRTIPYDFHYFCSRMWGEIKHQRGTTFEMFREQMLNTAMNWQKSLKDSLWNVVENFNINSV